MNKKLILTISLGILLIIGAKAVFPSEPYEVASDLSIEETLTPSNEELTIIFKELGRPQLFKMEKAANELLNLNSQLASNNSNVVIELIGKDESFYSRDHYPENEVFDPKTDSQYYYHAHRKGEHGHFHTFYMGPESDYSHLIAISMDEFGQPTRLFAITQWVDKEVMLSLDKIEEKVSQFKITHSTPSYRVNHWLNQMFVLFKPQIIQLLSYHTKKVQLIKCQKDVITYMPISIKDQKQLINRELNSNWDR